MNKVTNNKWILTLASVSLSVAAIAANPEADGIRARPGRIAKAPAAAKGQVKGQSYLLEKRDAEGNILGRYHVTGGVSPDKLPALIEKLQKTGKAPGVKYVAKSAISRKSSPKSEADTQESKQAWYGFHGGYRIGGYPGAGYYGGYWPSSYYGFGNQACYPTFYYPQPVCYQQSWNYSWTYGCGGYSYGIYI